MKVKIKRFDKEIPLPQYKTKGAVCVDLSARVDTTIKTHETGLIPLNIATKIPDGYFTLLASRSSTFKQGLMPANGIGIGDQDFCGDNDEWHFPVYNFTDSDVTVEKGIRIAQMMVLRTERIEFIEVDELKEDDRGGFGTTGKR